MTEPTEEASAILAKWLQMMTIMIRNTMGHVAIDTGDLLDCIDVCARRFRAGLDDSDLDSKRRACTISGAALKEYISRHHVDCDGITITTTRDHAFGSIKLGPGKWQIRKVG